MSKTNNETYVNFLKQSFNESRPRFYPTQLVVLATCKLVPCSCIRDIFHFAPDNLKASPFVTAVNNGHDSENDLQP